MGSLLGVILFLPFAGAERFFLCLAVTAAVTAVGYWAADLCGRYYGEHDSGRIVIDEIAGMLLALASFPADPRWLAAGFFLFRFFDIWKPPPARYFDRTWKNAAGVMADDLVAGLYANLTLQVVRILL